MINDVRHALRSLKRTPGFTFIVLLTLSVGIGANTAMFSVVNAVLLRPLSYQDPDALLRLTRGTSYPDLADIAGRAGTITGIAGYRTQFFDYSTGTAAERLDGALVTGRMLQLFGAATSMGRSIGVEDDRHGAERVVMLSSGFWRSHFAADPGVIGRVLTLSGESYTIVGVLPPSFRFPADRADVVAPFLPHAGREATARGAHTLRAFARVKTGVTLSAAQQELDGIAARLAGEYPETNQDIRFVLQGLRENLSGGVRQPLLILLATVGVVLLIACVNVANLLIARSASRRQEFALRAALGASRARIVRQVLTESIMLAVAGGVAGIGIAWWLATAIVGLAPEGVPRLENASLDGRVLLFAFLASVATGILFGTLPAWTSGAASVAQGARGGSRHTAGGNRLRGLLLVGEVALAMVLVVGAGLLVRSFVALMAQKPGFNTAGLLTGNVTLNGPRYGDIGARARFWEEFEARMRTVPGVHDVALTTDLPIGGLPIFHNLAFEGRAVTPGTEPEVYYRGVNANYFRAMGIPLLKGRTFTDVDRQGTPLVAVVNDAFARQYFPGEEVLGRRVRWASGDAGWITIVGVVADVRGLSLEQGEVPAVHIPHAQEVNPWRRWMDVAIRTDGKPVNLAASVRRELLALDPNVPVVKVRSMDDVVAASLADRRFNLQLLGGFAIVALLLAAAGTYGVMAYLVTQRTREIGVRLAIGAHPGDVFRLVVGRGLALAATGVVIGLAASALLTQVLQTMLFNVHPGDLPTLVGSAVVLLTSAGAACFVPAWRAARMDPLKALRHE
ncbi:MAG: ABC transporter permease [Vicinamibacterales bacterium]